MESFAPSSAYDTTGPGNGSSCNSSLMNECFHPEEIFQLDQPLRQQQQHQNSTGSTPAIVNQLPTTTPTTLLDLGSGVIYKKCNQISPDKYFASNDAVYSNHSHDDSSSKDLLRYIKKEIGSTATGKTALGDSSLAVSRSRPYDCDQNQYKKAPYTFRGTSTVGTYFSNSVNNNSSSIMNNNSITSVISPHKQANYDHLASEASVNYDYHPADHHTTSPSSHANSSFSDQQSYSTSSCSYMSSAMAAGGQHNQEVVHYSYAAGDNYRFGSNYVKGSSLAPIHGGVGGGGGASFQAAAVQQMHPELPLAAYEFY
uniref:Uncharacterized protein n=1 Tax=Anopheles stephensi TaxID=30069 RepID=A0A182XZN8_ANOST